MKMLTGDTINISEWTESELCNLCWYWDNHNEKTEGNIGSWIGVLHRVGSALCYWVLTEKGNIIVHNTVQHVTRDEYKNPEIQQNIRN